jgi:hypothetical protein
MQSAWHRRRARLFAQYATIRLYRTLDGLDELQH